MVYFICICDQAAFCCWQFCEKTYLHFTDHKSHDDKNKERHGNGSTSSTKDKNSLSKSAKFERQSSKVDEIEAKIREKSIKSFKSDKLNSFDMFAPKAPKPKLVMPKPMESPKPTPSTPIINNSLPKSSSVSIKN